MQQDGVVVFWHSDYVEAALKRVKPRRKAFKPLINHKDGFLIASVDDPFGNVLSLMYNAYFLEILSDQRTEHHVHN
jgi:hypothetical protein